MLRVPALFPERPVPGKTPWHLLILLLVAFLGQIILQTVSLPDETPRSAIERLTGIDIATPFTGTPVHDLMMSHMGHHTSIKGDKNFIPINGRHHHHHGDDGCPLCPLLGHILLALSAFIVMLGACRFIRTRWARPAQPRAPPLQEEWQFPPSRAPPISL